MRQAQETGPTAVFFGLQTPQPIGDDIGLVEICHQLGISFMQLICKTSRCWRPAAA